MKTRILAILPIFRLSFSDLPLSGGIVKKGLYRAVRDIEQIGSFRGRVGGVRAELHVAAHDERSRAVLVQLAVQRQLRIEREHMVVVRYVEHAALRTIDEHASVVVSGERKRTPCRQPSVLSQGQRLRIKCVHPPAQLEFRIGDYVFSPVTIVWIASAKLDSHPSLEIGAVCK